MSGTRSSAGTTRGSAPTSARCRGPSRTTARGRAASNESTVTSSSVSAEVGGDGHDERGRAAPEPTPRGAGRRRAVRDARGLDQARVGVALAHPGVRAVVPGDGVRAVRDQPTRGPGPVRELPVLAAVGAEALVEAADLVVPPAAAREDGADDEPVAGRVGVQQVAAGGVRVAEPGGLGQLARWRHLLDRVVGTGAGEVGVPPAADDHGLGQHLGQGHHALDEVRLGRRVGVEQHQHVAGARRHAEVADGGRAEPVVGLTHQSHPGRDHRRPPGPVVGDHHLVRRTGLTTSGPPGCGRARPAARSGPRPPRRSAGAPRSGRGPSGCPARWCRTAARSSAHRRPPRAVGRGGLLEPRPQVGARCRPRRWPGGAARPRGAGPGSRRRRR